jgi:hypothetical protein
LVVVHLREKGEGRREKGEGRREKGEGRREKGEGRREKGEGRREKGEGNMVGINRFAWITVDVEEQHQALQWFTQELGLPKRLDSPDRKRFLTVSPRSYALIGPGASHGRD